MITQKQFASLVETLNHKITKIEQDVKWIKRIIYYGAGIGTVAVGALIKIAVL